MRLCGWNMTWHNAVYGSRNGSDALGRPFDDGPVYGRVPDELIPEERLRRLGGKSFYRAHEVIDSARIHDFGYAYTDDGITLTALVDSADGYPAPPTAGSAPSASMSSR